MSKSAALVVACVGSSATAAIGSYDWIADLHSRPENPSARFVNFGVGGDLAYNTYERLPAVVQSHPNKVIVLIGGTDVLTRASKKVRRFLGVWKRFPHEPSPEWFEENLRHITREFRTRTAASVALCSLQPIGEDLTSQNAFQKRVNRLVDEYSAIIRWIAA
jgi:lysophospholipase L1-like esterase